MEVNKKKMSYKNIKNNLKKISDNLEDKNWDFNTAVTFYQIKSSCDRMTAVRIVKRSMRVQEQIKELLPKLEFVCRFYLNLMNENDLSEDEVKEYEDLIKDFESIFETTL